MTSLLKRMIEGMEAIPKTKLVGSDNKVGTDEKVIGEVTDTNIRRLFHFSRILKSDIAKKLEEYKNNIEIPTEPHDPSKCLKCQELMSLLDEKTFFDIVDKLFWAEVEKTFSPEQKVKQTESGGTGLRDGWKIVTLPNPKSSPIFGSVIVLG